MKRTEALMLASLVTLTPEEKLWLTGSQRYGHCLDEATELDHTKDVDILVCATNPNEVAAHLWSLASKCSQLKLEDHSACYDNDLNMLITIRGYCVNLIILPPPLYEAWKYTTMAINHRWSLCFERLDKLSRVEIFKAIRDAYLAGRDDAPASPLPF